MDWAALHWIRPAWLWLLPLVWLAVILFWRSHRAGGDWAKVTDPHLLEFLSGSQKSQGRIAQHGFKLLVASSLSLALLALAGPAWEKSSTGSFSAHHARVVVLDLSRSMLAEDIKPSRSAQAQFKLIDLLDQIEEGQLGLVAYAGQAFVIAPLSSDMETIKNLVPALNPDIMPVSGSRPGEALALAADLIRQAGFARGKIILIADSANSQALEVAANLADEGFGISVLGIGTEQGAPIPSGRGFVKNSSGQIVVSRLEVSRLQDLADAGNGEFFLLRADNSELTQLLAESEDDFVAVDGKDEALDARWLDQGYWLVVLLLPLSLLFFRKGWVFILPIFILPYWSAPLQAQPVSPPPEMSVSAETVIPEPGAVAKFWQRLWKNRDQQAAIALQNKQYEQLLQNDPAPRFRAQALYRSGAYTEAAELWQQLQDSTIDSQQRSSVAYNRGNALAAQNELDEAISAYEQSLQFNPENEDAKANLEILRQLKEQQNQDGGEQDNEDQGENQQQQEEQQQDQQDQQQQQQQDDSQSEEEPAAEPEEEESVDEQEQQADQEQAEEQEDEQMEELTQEQQWTEEDEQAKEQWLRRIADDPGGLLRRKLNQEYQRRNRQAEKNQPW